VGDRVVRTAEKQPISDHALIGAYGFGSARTFFAAAHEIVLRNERTGNGEFYVSSVYNHLLRQGRAIRLVDADRYWSMGTPEELRACLADPGFLAHARALRHALASPAPAALS
jgi:dTDP-glucose pyrophosphorylase